MNSSNDSDFSDFLHGQYKAVKEAVDSAPFESTEKYTDRKFIAEGAQKKIYKVYDNSCSREIAMAVLKGGTQQDIAQFCREARINALLQHPNIMPVYESGINEEGDHYFTMKLGGGCTLQSRLEKNSDDPVDSMEAVEIFLKVCDALSFAHSKGILHRDLKPENIYLGKFGEVMLSDWGLASLMYDKVDEQILDDGALKDIDLKVSLKGLIKGTPGYIAPEILSAKDYSVQSDIFALGAILHSILTGSVPVKAPTIEETLAKTRTGEFEPFEEAPGSCSESLKAISRKALKVDKSKRYQSVNEMIDDLKAFQSGFATKAEEAGFRTQLNLFYKRNKAICNLSVVFLLVIFISGVFFINSIRQREQQAVKLLDQLTIADKNRKNLEKDLAPVYFEKAEKAFINIEIESALALAQIVYNYDKSDKKVSDLYGKILISKQRFTEAAEVLKGVDDRLADLSAKYANLKTGDRLEHGQLIEFLKEVGITPKNNIAWIYKNILFEEFRLVKEVKKKMELMAAELRFRNPKVRDLKIGFKESDGGYEIDLSDNPKLNTIMILEKLGASRVKSLNLSNTAAKGLDPLKFMRLEKLIVRNTGKMSMGDFPHLYESLDAENSKTDFSIYLRNMPLKELNIHNSAFTNYHVLPTLKKLRKLTVSIGKLPDNIRRKLHKNCEIIEK